MGNIGPVRVFAWGKQGFSFPLIPSERLLHQLAMFGYVR